MGPDFLPPQCGHGHTFSLKAVNPGIPEACLPQVSVLETLPLYVSAP